MNQQMIFKKNPYYLDGYFLRDSKKIESFLFLLFNNIEWRDNYEYNCCIKSDDSIIFDNWIRIYII